MTARLGKKEKFDFQDNSRKSNKVIFIVAALVVILGVGGFVFLNKGETYEYYNVGEVSYKGQNVQMTDVQNTVKNGKVQIALSDIKNGNIIYTEYSKGNVRTPLTAFVAPSGDLIAAVSMCEPCRGTRFHIQDDELVCNACGTRWTLDGLKGTWGGCLKYPPEVLNYELDEEGQNIILDEEEVANWQPRPL